jgi:hypothetical protein
MRGIVLAASIVVAGVQSAAAIPCTESAGRSAARRYADQCQMVSVTPHAACRPYYSCPIIQDEIRRGCAALGKDAPLFCKTYRRD